MDKVIILGGRSGTLARVLESSGLKLLSDKGSTEKSSLSKFIINNIDDSRSLKSFFRLMPDFDLLKCPELAFCLKEFSEVFPSVKYIWLTRSLYDRVHSHEHLGWGKTIFERVQKNRKLFDFITERTDFTLLSYAETDLAYFETMDICTTDFFNSSLSLIQSLSYNYFNDYFENSMRHLSEYLNIDYEQNIDQWIKIKNQKQQAGRWIK